MNNVVLDSVDVVTHRTSVYEYIPHLQAIINTLSAGYTIRYCAQLTTV